jgi:hypothetical protein
LSAIFDNFCVICQACLALVWYVKNWLKKDMSHPLLSQASCVPNAVKVSFVL